MDVGALEQPPRARGAPLVWSAPEADWRPGDSSGRLPADEAAGESHQLVICGD